MCDECGIGALGEEGEEFSESRLQMKWKRLDFFLSWSNLVNTTRLIDFFFLKRCQKIVNIIERKSEMVDWLIMWYSCNARGGLRAPLSGSFSRRNHLQTFLVADRRHTTVSVGSRSNTFICQNFSNLVFIKYRYLYLLYKMILQNFLLKKPFFVSILWKF